MTFWTIVGWLILGGTFGYATERWRIIYVIVLAMLGLSLIADPEPPRLLIGATDGGSWAETIAFIGGLIVGGRIAKQEHMTSTKSVETTKGG